MKATLADFAKDQFVYNFTDCTREELDNKLHLFFSSEGYNYKGDKDGGKIYTKGNQALRVILGAFWKYFKIFLSVKGDNNMYSVLVQKDASGFMGGVFGVAQVQKEFAHITDAFKSYFSK